MTAAPGAFVADRRPADGEVVACELLGQFGSFGWWVQGGLGCLCFATLVYKRHTDTVRRSWLVWFLDVTKQGVAAMTIHIANLGVASILSRVEDNADACSWYWISVVVDCTLGLALTSLLLDVLRCYCRWAQQPERADFGEYGDPIDWHRWYRQLFDFQLVAAVAKLLNVLLFVAFHDALGWFAFASLALLDAYPDAKLVFVMVFTPVLMNVVAFWVIDSLLMKQALLRNKHVAVASDDQKPELGRAEASRLEFPDYADWKGSASRDRSPASRSFVSSRSYSSTDRLRDVEAAGGGRPAQRSPRGARGSRGGWWPV